MYLLEVDDFGGTRLQILEPMELVVGQEMKAKKIMEVDVQIDEALAIIKTHFKTAKPKHTIVKYLST